MAKKLLLCASGTHLTAALWSGRRLTDIQEFSAEDEHAPGAFQSYLRAAHGRPAYLLADTVDEDYRFETLPHTFGRDRREMLERKLKQLYRNSPFYSAIRQQREGGKRRDDRYLFAALTNPDVFEPWLQLLTAAKNPIVGVFPLAMDSLGLVKRLGVDAPNLLLVSKHSAGVRQTFLQEQRFRISRLTPLRLDAGTSGKAIEAYAEEIHNTRVYLDALNITHVDDSVNVVILDQDGSLSALGSAVSRGRRNLLCEYFGPDQLCAKTGVDRAALDASDDALHLFLLGRATPEFNLAPPALTAGYTLYRTSRALYAASAVVVVAGMAWTGANFYRAHVLGNDREDTLVRTQEQQRHYQDITRAFPPSPAPAARLKLTVDVAQRVAGLSRFPDAAFRVAGQALDAHPDITLTGLTWKLVRPPENQGAPAGSLSQSALLQLELETLPGDYKGALQRINDFVKELTKQDSVASARAAKLPINLASADKLAGSTAAPQREQPTAAPFEVEVVLKPGV